jgi:hypothetical protein
MPRIPSTTTIVRHLAEALADKLDDKHDWTVETFRAASAPFASPGFTPHAARRPKKSRKAEWGREYRVDLCVTDDARGAPDDPFSYHRLALALECEWSPSRKELKYDFCKLVDTLAARRVFVGFVRQHDDVEKFIEEARQFVAEHRHVVNGEEYGVLLFATDSMTPCKWVIRRVGNGAKSARLA